MNDRRPPSDFGQGYPYPGTGSTPPPPRAPSPPSGPPYARPPGYPPADAAVNYPADPPTQQSPSAGPAPSGAPYGAQPNTVWGAPHADPHADYHRQAAAHFGGTADPQPHSYPPPQAAPGYGATTRYGSQGRQLPSAVSAEKVTQWLAAPGHRKLVAGAVGGLIALILFLSGGAQAKIFALGLVIGVWAICFRHGYHEKAGLHAQSQLPADEAIRAAIDVANALRGPLSSVQFNGSGTDRADFTVRGSTWKPLTFHVALRRDPSGWIFLSTHLDSWTWRRQRVNFIPVPLTKSMDGYGLYKAFGDRLLTELQRRDPSTSGTFHTRPPTQ